MQIVIAAVNHPSLAGHVELFLDDLRAESRYFGPRAAHNPKPFPSLIEAVAGGEGFRFAAVECGRVIGLARVDQHAELFVAVVAERRNMGVGSALCEASLQHAGQLGIDTVVIRSTRRSTAVRRLGARLGCVTVDRGHGRVELIVAPDRAHYLRRSA
jgi:GNAT superfamily N-acetyltransferase